MGWEAKYTELAELRLTEPEKRLDALKEAFEERQRGRILLSDCRLSANIFICLVSDELISALEKQISLQQTSSASAEELNESVQTLRQELSEIHSSITTLSEEKQNAANPPAETQSTPELDHAFALVCSLSGIEVYEIEYTETEVLYKCSQAGKYGGQYFLATTILCVWKQLTC